MVANDQKNFYELLIRIKAFSVTKCKPRVFDRQVANRPISHEKKIKNQGSQGSQIYSQANCKKKNLSPSRTDKTHPADCALRQGTVNEIAMDKRDY